MDDIMQEAIKAVEKLSYFEWQHLKISVDIAFDKKKREFERELKLSPSDDLQKIIRERFG